MASMTEKTSKTVTPDMDQLSKLYNLTKKEVADIYESFNTFDKDRNGRIDVQELGLVLRSLGKNPTEDEIRSMINDVDADGSGVVEFAEFLTIYNKKKVVPMTEEETIKSAFKTFDRDGDGYITPSEVDYVMQCLGKKLTESELKRIVKIADADGNGRIDYKEFAEGIRRK